MTLRDQIGRHLRNRFGHCGTCADSETVSEYWLIMADEVIRQMEWARRQAIDETTEEANRGNESSGSDVRHIRIDYGQFTLAPPDWKPE